MSDEPHRTGRCLCRAVTIEARGEPRFVSACHCESCRRASSAPCVVWAGFMTAQVRLAGAALTHYASSPGVRRFFCATCGSPLAFEGDAWPGETHIPVCAFNAPETLAPRSDHFAAEKLPWSALLGASHS